MSKNRKDYLTAYFEFGGKHIEYRINEADNVLVKDNGIINISFNKKLVAILPPNCILLNGEFCKLKKTSE